MAKKQKVFNVTLETRGPIPIPSYFVDKLASDFLDVVQTDAFMNEFKAWEQTPEAQRLLKYCGCID